MTLGEYVSKVMTEKGFSAKDVAERSKRGGLDGIHPTYVTKICSNPELNNLTVKALRALANGLQEPVEDIFRIVQNQSVDLSDMGTRQKGRLSDIHDLLPELDRNTLLEMAEVLFRASYTGEQSARLLPESEDSADVG